MSSLFSQVVFLPDSTVSYQRSFFVTVSIRNMAERDSLLAYQFGLRYEPACLKVLDVTTDGTVVEDWGAPLANITDSLLQVAGFSTEMVWLDESRPLLNLEIQVKEGVTGQVTLTFEEAYLFDLNGFIPLDSLIGACFEVLHNVPPVIMPIPEMRFLEDMTGVYDLNGRVFDFEDSLDALTFLFSGNEHVSVSVDACGRLVVVPPADWNGTDSLHVRVEDTGGEADETDFRVVVVSVDDPPKPFRLLRPENGAVLNAGQGYIDFVWEEAENVDEGDIVVYFLQIAEDPAMTLNIHEFAAGEECSLNVSLDFLTTGTHFWRVRAQDDKSNPKFRYSTDTFGFDFTTSVDPAFYPDRIMLHANMPNPFNPHTEIRFDLPRRARIILDVRDLLGRRVCVLEEAIREAGRHALVWDGRNESGVPVPSGVYILSLRAEKIRLNRKMTLIR
ncbi:MAG TPA: hypothetical protein ENN03_06165 [bacterium]|nr:hypothetical protein [bacterium]